MPEIERIKLSEPNHINTFLTHWTGRCKTKEEAFKILSTIVTNGELKFSPCEISFPTADYKLTSQMICFTDTPILQSRDHCARYNHFGISFNKNELIEYGANPVLYLVDNRQKHQECLTRVQWNNNEERNLISWLKSCQQPYDSKKFSKDNWAEFYEREWRINRILPFHWVSMEEQLHGAYNEYPFKGKLRKVEKNSDLNSCDFFLQFDKNIVENIVVADGFEDDANKLMAQSGLDNRTLYIIEN